jgi:hypothetical protein
MADASITVMNIWTKKFGAGRRLAGIDQFFCKNAGGGVRSDIEPPNRFRGFWERKAPTRDLRGAP